MMTTTTPRFKQFVLITFLVSSLVTICFSAQKKHHHKAMQKHADSGLTDAQKKIMLQRTMEEKLHYYNKDSVKRNKKK